MYSVSAIVLETLLKAWKSVSYLFELEEWAVERSWRILDSGRRAALAQSPQVLVHYIVPLSFQYRLISQALALLVR